MSDFGFLNEHTIPNAEMANVLRAVYSHASNAEKYYTISSEKCISYIREGCAEICKMYSLVYKINQNCKWFGDYLGTQSQLLNYVGPNIYGKLDYIYKICKSGACSTGDILKQLMWNFYLACADLDKLLQGKAVISNTPKFLYCVPALDMPQKSVKDELFASLNKSIADFDKARYGQEIVLNNSNEVTDLMQDLFKLVKDSNEKLANQDKLINDLEKQFKSFYVQSDLQQQDYDRMQSKINEIFEMVRINGSSASIDDVWAKVNTIDEKIRSMESIQTQKLKSVTNFTNRVNSTIDRFVDVNEKYLKDSGQGKSVLLSALKKVSVAVKEISENIVKTISIYEASGKWEYTRIYKGINLPVSGETKADFSFLEWLAEKIDKVADVLRDIDKKG